MGAVSENRISIIVPSFNTEKYIGHCLVSLINQTYEDIEILVVDDGSQDNSLDIIREYATSCPKIRFFSQKNGGAGSARNLGLRNASGEYIMFCDSDDTFEPQMCKKMLDTIINQQVDLVMCNTRLHRKDVIQIPKEGDSHVFRCKHGKYLAGSSEINNINIYLWNKIFKKTLINQFDISFAEDCKRSEDVLFVHKYISVIKSVFALYEPLYNHHEVEGSLMYEFDTKHIKLNDLLDKIYLIELFYDFLVSNGLFYKNEKYFISRFSQEMTYAWERVAENWEQPFLERLGSFMGKVNIETWGNQYFDLLATCLVNKHYEKSALCFNELLISQGRKRIEHIPQESIEPAFVGNNVAVFFNCDNNFVPYLAVTLASIIENSNKDFNYDLIVLNEGMTVRNKNILRNFVEAHPNFSLRFFSMNYYSKQYDIGSFLTSRHISTPVYYRIFAPMIFKNYERIVYLDSDLIVNTDISKLFLRPIMDKAILAVPDYYVCQPLYSPKYCKYAKELLKIKDLSKYFNSGVLVYNLQKMREKEYMQEFLKMRNVKLEYHDQDILNSALQDDLHIIEPEWNYQVHCKNDDSSYLNFYQPLKKLNIVHFTSGEKPWLMPTIDFADVWWTYARKTPFYEMLFGKAFNSEVVRMPYAVDISHLKRSFWYNRILSKITLGETKKKYTAKKSMLRNKIRALQQT